MRTPAHGRGLLRVGGTNAGGSGRPPSEVRRACRESFYERIPILEKIADGEGMTTVKALDGTVVGTAAAEPSERIRAIAELGKIGMAGNVSLEDVRERLRAQWQVLRDELPVDIAARVIPRLSAVWQA
jgi:hypothetical protein